MRNIFKSSFLSAALTCTVLLAPLAAQADEHVLILLDVTGSMGAGSIPGMTRIQVAKQRLSDFLDIVPSQPTRYAFWTFEGTGFTQVYGFSDNRSAAEVKAAVNLATLGGVTPLAGSVCSAVDALINFLPDEFHTKRIQMASDGDENSTPNADQCFGPSSASVYPTLDVNSWQWKVRNKACTGNANAPGPCAGGIPPSGLTLIVNIDHLFDFVNGPTMSLAPDLETAQSRTGFAAAARVSVDEAFFRGLSQESKGRYQAITPSTPLTQALPVPGDATSDGCVNVLDRSAVLQQFGQKVAPGTPTDFNRDGVVNIFDYNTVLQNFGRGCK